MSRQVGTVSRGIRMPIIRQGDDIINTVVDSVISASKDPEWGWTIRNSDIIAVTESVVARAQGNYASVDDIAQDIIEKFGENQTIGVVFPILSRNRFSLCLEGIAKAARKVVILFSFPTDEVGNELIPRDIFQHSFVNTYDILTLQEFRKTFGYPKHPFTNIDYVDYYQQIIKGAGAECDIIFSNIPIDILEYTTNVLCCDIHTLPYTKAKFINCPKDIEMTIYGIDEVLRAPINGSGYNEKYGLLGSNKATEDTLKLFPRDSQYIVDGIKDKMYELTGKSIEVLIYGDGAFKDPVGGIWEWADPVVAPFFTDGLNGTPNELKIKYLADNNFSELDGEALKDAITNAIKTKEANLVGTMQTEGTTPRRLTDLIGSLCDLTSGSGDKGTPVVYIQGYFDNYSCN